MDDKSRVGMLDREQHLLEESNPPGHVDRPPVAPGGDRLADDVLEREPWPPFVNSGVVELGDVRMIERSEDAALALEALDEARRVRWKRMPKRQLESDVWVERAVDVLASQTSAVPPEAMCCKSRYAPTRSSCDPATDPASAVSVRSRSCGNSSRNAERAARSPASSIRSNAEASRLSRSPNPRSHVARSRGSSAAASS